MLVVGLRILVIVVFSCIVELHGAPGVVVVVLCAGWWCLLLAH